MQLITDSPNLIPPISRQQKIHRLHKNSITPRILASLIWQLGIWYCPTFRGLKSLPFALAAPWEDGKQHCQGTAMMTQQWFSDFGVHPCRLEGLFQSDCCTPPPELLGLRCSLKITFLQSSQVILRLVPEPHFENHHGRQCLEAGTKQPT